jgi:SPX domain protein involved in polyphosphate accumulation
MYSGDVACYGLELLTGMLFYLCRLEKYVNMNFTGFHKILKKHDKRLPNPCRAFYTARLHNQSWVRGDFSDVLVVMSRVYSSLRGDQEHEAVQDERQVRRGTYRTMFLHRSIRN